MLEGPDVVLATMGGLTRYATGDHVVVRETIRDAKLFNGSTAVVLGIDGESGLRRWTDDGRDMIIDTFEYPSVQHGYAGTAYRAQGATHTAELTLAVSTIDNREFTVGMTRHREAYGRRHASVVELTGALHPETETTGRGRPVSPYRPRPGAARA